MKLSSNLFVGITSWNSEALLPLCLDSLRKSVPDAQIHVFDNGSVDASVKIATDFGATVTIGNLGQAQALNFLARASSRRYTLLIHSDVVFASSIWLDVVAAEAAEQVALIAPEDIGCGQYTRTWGKGMPESSFLFFITKHLNRHRIRPRAGRFGLPSLQRDIDLYGEHITYNLPRRIHDAGLVWKAMEVHLSERMPEPFYTPDFVPGYWTPELGHLRYGLGNFYSINGHVTHYHNWYDRRLSTTQTSDSRATSEVDGGGVPLAFLKAACDNLISDYNAGSLRIPRIAAH